MYGGAPGGMNIPGPPMGAPPMGGYQQNYGGGGAPAVVGGMGPKMRGHLAKCSKAYKNWKTRYFVIVARSKGTMLEYYESEPTDANLDRMKGTLGSIPIQGSELSDFEAGNFEGRPAGVFHFGIRAAGEGRVYPLEAPNSGVRDEWKEALRLNGAKIVDAPLQTKSRDGSVREGYLEKMGSTQTVKGWKRRYFVLDMYDKELYYWAEQKQAAARKKPLGSVQLSSNTDLVDIDGEALGRWDCLTLTPKGGKKPGRRYLFSAANAQVKKGWVNALHLAITGQDLSKLPPAPSAQAGYAPGSAPGSVGLHGIPGPPGSGSAPGSYGPPGYLGAGVGAGNIPGPPGSNSSSNNNNTNNDSDSDSSSSSSESEPVAKPVKRKKKKALPKPAPVASESESDSSTGAANPRKSKKTSTRMGAVGGMPVAMPGIGGGAGNELMMRLKQQREKKAQAEAKAAKDASSARPSRGPHSGLPPQAADTDSDSDSSEAQMPSKPPPAADSDSDSDSDDAPPPAKTKTTKKKKLPTPAADSDSDSDSDSDVAPPGAPDSDSDSDSDSSEDEQEEEPTFEGALDKNKRAPFKPVYGRLFGDRLELYESSKCKRLDMTFTFGATSGLWSKKEGKFVVQESSETDKVNLTSAKDKKEWISRLAVVIKACKSSAKGSGGGGDDSKAAAKAAKKAAKAKAEKAAAKAAAKAEKAKAEKEKAKAEKAAAKAEEKKRRKEEKEAKEKAEKEAKEAAAAAARKAAAEAAEKERQRKEEARRKEEQEREAARKKAAEEAEKAEKAKKEAEEAKKEAEKEAERKKKAEEAEKAAAAEAKAAEKAARKAAKKAAKEAAAAKEKEAEEAAAAEAAAAADAAAAAKKAKKAKKKAAKEAAASADKVVYKKKKDADGTYYENAATGEKLRKKPATGDIFSTKKDADGTKFYVNARTKASQWEKPW